MKNNQSTLVLAAFLLAGSAISCSMFGGGTSNGNAKSNGNSMSNKNIASSTPVPATDCPTTTFSPSELKDGLAKYEGCTLNIQGKLWEVRTDYVTLIDTSARASGSGDLLCGGNFSGGKYSEIGLELTGIRFRQQYERLPVATFTGKVETASGYTGLKNCVLTNVQRR